MGTGLTFLALALLTTWLVRRHLRARGGAGGPACPRCRAALPEGAARCPGCGVPLSAYEVVAAPEASGAPEPADGGRVHAVVRADVCVGCGTCAAACPEPGALEVRGKVAVVDRERCVAHGKCAEACPVGAIVLASGRAVQRVEVPDLDPHFQSTSVPGLYVAGEAGGRGLIKNAVNEGKIAVEHAAARLAAAGPSPAGVLDLAIVGAGPAGLSAGLEARRRGLRYAVLEQGTLADTIRKYPRHKLLMAEPLTLPLYGDLWIADGSKERLLEVWERILRETELAVETGRRALSVTPEGGLFRIETASGALAARSVVLAIGRRGTPRRLEVPGEELSKVLYDVVEMEPFRGRRVLVVGGGDSAVESALGLARQPGTEVALSYRGDAFTRLKPRNREKLEAAVSARTIRAILRSAVREIGPEAVTLEREGRPEVLPNDDVIVRIGGEAPSAFLARAGVRIVRKEIALGLVLALAATLARAQLSPGPLSRAHAKLEGTLHCLDCHDRAGASDAKCLACHREIGALRDAGRGLHAREGRGACASCHPEHAGEDFDLVSWGEGGEKGFDHARAGWPLAGKHAGRPCADCHAPRFRKAGAKGAWTGLEPSCGSCHRDVHAGTAGADCARCHGSEVWKPAKPFDHAATAFPLGGKHATTPCLSCHKAAGPAFKPLRHAACADCHRDPHAGKLGAACASCHAVEGWDRIAAGSFDHDRTRYPLRGKHRSAPCASCHRPGGAPLPAAPACASCHKDPHAGQARFGPAPQEDCGTCHVVDGFRPARMDASRHDRSAYPLRGKHAAVACASCHVRGERIVFRPSRAACADCHKDPHRGQFASRADGGRCEACHGVEGFKPAAYPAAEHARAFALEGKHAAATCAACHPQGSFRGVPKDCAGCHRDPHRARFRDDCARCHRVDDFRAAGYDAAAHGRAALPLEGAHRAVPCTACHRELERPRPASSLKAVPGPDLPFQDARRRCAECHADPHAGRFPGGCDDCHGLAAWRPPARFDHAARARFPLAGAHATAACASCHPIRPGPDGKPAPFYAPHPRRCEDCHAPSMLREARR